jgi:hypothetical protein
MSTFSRRQLLTTLAAGVTVAAAGRLVKAQTPTRIPIIDCHIHLFD